MDGTSRDHLAGTVGVDMSRCALLKEIATKVTGLDVAASDDDLDRWWGSVEVDRLASGLTLATVAKLSEPGEGDPAGPWLQKSDEHGDEVTELTADGRTALRQLAPTEHTEVQPALTDTQL